MGVCTSVSTQAITDAWKVFAVFLTVLLAILIIIVIVVARKINVAIALIEEASTVMLRLPSMTVRCWSLLL